MAQLQPPVQSLYLVTLNLYFGQAMHTKSFYLLWLLATLVSSAPLPPFYDAKIFVTHCQGCPDPTKYNTVYD
ncbi:hypothetical protein PCANC_19055 [Puccinia coronata f. sp. avenae]|uniref:Uncharacterized protein n=1 Tax=Puccinia coronata f. sp. avenae TaxID=200324 RepID=A0A2N5S7F3_9BASI|nr:hypothetical protein PCANC_24860 [Puccinia coronata f. sp. avenae]PLW09171.1 hypothetical protein PCASD_23049 [Puccinia coronata f. sp. avenae]PLW35608.1 hypothetical protein PCANC_19055 [Puccinia coronata f. sp. avenae]PLW43973.1 hypothetical protein PCASD_06486 [Puccinia coronata f. sp. avenae]